MHFYGLFGYPLGHSISPEIQRKIYQVANIEAAYKLFEIKEHQLPAALQAMKTLSIEGANVTIPYKQKMMPLLEDVSELGQRLNAINTIKNDRGRLIGYNTDYDGIDLTFRRNQWEVAGKTAYILGSGGASQTIAHYLKDHGASQIYIVSRTLRENKENNFWQYLTYEALEKQAGDFLINCTPVGMSPRIEESPVDKETVTQFSVVFDMIYNPVETKLLQTARKLNKENENGLTMLVGQAIRSVEIWEDKRFSDEINNEILSYFYESWEGS